MQFYWRIMEELRYLGEIVVFHDPRLIRQYTWWRRKNSVGIALSAADYTSKVVSQFTYLGSSPSLN